MRLVLVLLSFSFCLSFSRYLYISALPLLLLLPLSLSHVSIILHCTITRIQAHLSSPPPSSSFFFFSHSLGWLFTIVCMCVWLFAANMLNVIFCKFACFSSWLKYPNIFSSINRIDLCFLFYSHDVFQYSHAEILCRTDRHIFINLRFDSCKRSHFSKKQTNDLFVFYSSSP